jgi:structural maintenance of chromosome 4
VEQIAMMKPRGQGENDEGLLEYFEDIIGSDRFKVDIEEKGKELETLNEAWTEKLNRVKV